MKRILEIPAAIFRGIANVFKAIFNGIVWFFKAIFNGIASFFNFIKRQILAFFAALKNPFGSSVGTSKGLIYSAVVGVIVAVVALTLQPFGLAGFSHASRTLYLLGFGVMAFLGMAFCQFLLPKIAANFYDEYHWTVGRQIIQIVLISLIISVLCAVYANALNITSVDFVQVLGITFVASLLGGTILTFIQESMQRSKYTTSAADISRNLGNLKLPASKQSLPVLLFGSGNQKLSLLPNQLIYAETSADSTNFYYQDFMGVAQKTVNDSLANIEKEFSNHPQFVRSGKNHIVNLRALQNIKGSARGYHLTLARTKQELSVSQKNIGAFEKAVG